jgi:predicted DNA-binding transcriptional regulator
MQRSGLKADKNIEKTIHDILKSRAISRIYLYLLRKNGAKTEEIIRGTKLHPSTVRETLSKMYSQKLIYRIKIKNESIGKNPFIYYPLPPIELIKRYSQEIENRLNKLANLTIQKKNNDDNLSVKIKILKEWKADD